MPDSDPFTEARIVAAQSALKLTVKHKVDIGLAGTLLLVNVLACLDKEDHAFVKQVLKG